MSTADADDPPGKSQSQPDPLPSPEVQVNSQRRKSTGVNQSETAVSFFAPPDSKGKRVCLLDNCGESLISNKTTKANLVNHVARKHPGEWKLALEAAKPAKNAEETLQTPHSSSTPTPAATSTQSMSLSKPKGPLQKLMLQSRQSTFNTNLIDWIIEDQLPYAKVKSPKFIKMIRGLNPGITIFSKHTVSRRIKALYANSKPAVFSFLRSQSE